MENDINIVKISDGIELINLPASRFKTSQVSVSMAMPLSKETASVNALTGYLLSRSCEKYPHFTTINKKLAELYGASLSVSVSRIGENQLLKIGITAIDDRFALDNSCISYQCVDLLLNLLFTPNLEDGEFKAQDIEMEKRLLLERLQSEENEKRIYALRQMEKSMFQGEPFAINPLGSVEDIERITAEDVMNAWVRILTTSKILISIVGNVEHRLIADNIEKTFSDICRSYQPLSQPVIIPRAEKIKEVEEKMDINQGKLVLGFRIDLDGESQLTSAMTSTIDVFGGGPYSRLFTTVREKMSLCYYCNARYNKNKSVMIVQCGCEEENMDKAVAEIKNQLVILTNGEFTKEEFESSKISLRDNILGYYDNPEVLESWYVLQMCDNQYISPETKAEQMSTVSFEQVSECAKKITLDTVYRLVGNKEAE